MSELKNCKKCGEKSVDHEQEHINYKEHDVCIDKGLGNLLKILWEKGIDTNFSCIGEHCPCDVSSCRMEMAHIVFWSDDNLIKFMDPFFKPNFLSEYGLSHNVYGLKKKFTIVRTKDEIYDPNRKTATWRWESAAPAATVADDDEGLIEGIPIPPQYRDRIRWKLMFPKEDIPAIIRVLTNTKFLEREITHYQLKNGEIEILGRLSIKDGKIDSSGIYSDVKIFNEKNAEADYKEYFEYLSKENISYNDFLKTAKRTHENNFVKYESGEEDIMALLVDIQDTYVTIETK